jgi:hypothetical protein
MNFGERKTQGGIVLRSDDGKSHGIRPRWGQIYKIGPEQKEFSIGQWILIEHGRWTRRVRIDDGESEKDIWRIDTNAILAVSDDAPDADSEIIVDSI